MALIRWDPFREIERLEPFRDIDTLQRQMNRLFERLTPTTNGGEAMAFGFVPAAEMQETDEAIQLRLEVPGLEPKDIEVEVTTDAVSISGERRSETKTEEKGIARSEFRYGRFQRVIPLPSEVQNDKVEAEYKDGILRLTLPKAVSERRKSVKVNIG
jgi:HSP20 family protein